MTGLLQTLEQVAVRSAIIEESDPHGIIISAVSIIVVFFALLILYLAYLFIGRCVSRLEERKILLDLPPEGGSSMPEDSTHDKESYRITIIRKPKTTMQMTDFFSSVSDIPTADDSHENTDNKMRNCEKGIVKSPLPGVITALKVNIGDKVSYEGELAVLEAMKMENTIESEMEGTVTEIYVSPGDTILEGTAIMKIQ